MPRPPDDWYQESLEFHGIAEIAVNGRIVETPNGLSTAAAEGNGRCQRLRRNGRCRMDDVRGFVVDGVGGVRMLGLVAFGCDDNPGEAARPGRLARARGLSARCFERLEAQATTESSRAQASAGLLLLERHRTPYCFPVALDCYGGCRAGRALQGSRGRNASGGKSLSASRHPSRRVADAIRYC